MNEVVSGTFVQGMLLDTSAKVNMNVMVTTAGTYTISTNSVNGYTFSGKGTFAATGLQSVVLTAAGTPITNGINSFTANGNNSSSCQFKVAVVLPVGVNNHDLFPLTKNSYWTYDDLLNPGDTITRTITDSLQSNGNLYKILTEKLMNGLPVTFHFRRADSIYYEYVSVDKYTLSVKFIPQIIQDFPFLNLNQNTGTTWNTDEYIGTASFGQKIYIKYNFYCTDSKATVTLNGKTFINVYKTMVLPQIRSDVYYPYNTTGEKTDIWYAKGIGIIYSKSVNNSITTAEKRIRYWQVN